jgi:glutathione-dependent peroxiredoxin
MSLPTAADLVGTSLPSLTFRFRDSARWIDRTTEDLFAGKRVVLFGLPGAFTPTCSSNHVPRYDELHADFAAAGVDELIVVSVNDPFVMEAWEKEQGTTHVTYLGDGNGELTEALGLLVDKSDLAFGKRSWRYAMVVNDGVIEQTFIEADVPGDPYQVSDADTVLAWLDASARPQDIAFIGREGCGHCVRARRMLDEAGLRYTEIPASPRLLRAFSGRGTTPQVFVDGQHIGGADELGEWLAAR